jgi:predicted nucleic-acid-binding protein
MYTRIASREFIAAIRTHDRAAAKFQDALASLRAMLIGISEFVAASDEYSKAAAAFEIARNKERDR